MSDEAIDPACAVCGRRLLAGERPSTYVSRNWAEAIVCELCKPRAEAAGWMRPEEAEELRAAGGQRERRRPRGQVLEGLRARFDAARGGERPGGARRGQRDEAAAPAPEPPPRAAAAGTGSQPTAAEAELAEALRSFNFSDHRRTVAGLTRTLGAPRAGALPIETAGGVPGFCVTVAWELTWYQWEIAAGEHGIEVRESGKGETIDQLRAEHRSWNLIAGSDGTLHVRAAEEAQR